MKLNKTLSALSSQQDEMLKQKEYRAYVGLCMKEAALLTERAKELEDPFQQDILKACALDAMSRAIETSHKIESSV